MLNHIYELSSYTLLVQLLDLHSQTKETSANLCLFQELSLGEPTLYVAYDSNSLVPHSKNTP